MCRTLIVLVIALATADRVNAQTLDPRLDQFASSWKDVVAIRTTWGRQFDRTLATDPSMRFRCTLADITLGRPHELLHTLVQFNRPVGFAPDELPWAIENWVLTNPDDRSTRDGRMVYIAPDGLRLESTVSGGAASGEIRFMSIITEHVFPWVEAGPHALAWWILDHPRDAARATIENLPSGGFRMSPPDSMRSFEFEPSPDGFRLVRATHAPASRDMNGAVFIQRFEDYADLPALPPFPRRVVSDTPNIRQMPDGLLVYEHDNRNISTMGLIRAERLDRFPPEIPEQVRARAETQGVTRPASLPASNQARDDSRALRIENGRIIQPPPPEDAPAPEPLADTTRFLRWGGAGVLALGLGWLVWRWKAGRV